MIYKSENGRTIKIVTSLLAMINYENYYGSDFLGDLEKAVSKDEYTKVLQCISACYVSPKTQKLNEESIEEFVNDQELMNIVIGEEKFLGKFANAFMGSSGDKGKRKKKKQQ